MIPLALLIPYFTSGCRAVEVDPRVPCYVRQEGRSLVVRELEYDGKTLTEAVIGRIQKTILEPRQLTATSIGFAILFTDSVDHSTAQVFRRSRNFSPKPVYEFKSNWGPSMTWFQDGEIEIVSQGVDVDRRTLCGGIWVSELGSHSPERFPEAIAALDSFLRANATRYPGWTQASGTITFPTGHSLSTVAPWWFWHGGPFGGFSLEDGRVVLHELIADKRVLSLWDSKRNRRVRVIPGGESEAIAIARGLLLILRKTDEDKRECTVYDVKTGKKLRTMAAAAIG